MPRYKKRKREARNLPREQGRFVSKKETIITYIQEATGVEEDEFEASNKRKRYTGTSRTTIWRRKKEQKKLEKGIENNGKLLENGMLTNIRNQASVNTITPTFQAQNPTPSNDNMTPIQSLQVRLEKVNRQCSFTKSSKLNMPTYDYLRLVSISKFIELLLDGKGKMDASRQIAETVWNKGDYMSRCIRDWGDHYIRTGELSIGHQGKHTKWRGFLNDEDVSEDCRAWIRQQKPELRSPAFLKAMSKKNTLNEAPLPKRHAETTCICGDIVTMKGEKVFILMDMSGLM